MKRFVFLLLASLSLSGAVGAQPVAAANAPAAPAGEGSKWAGESTPAPGPDAALPLRLRLSDEVVKQAVREVREEAREQEGEEKNRPSDEVLSGDRYQAFARQFGEAQKPGCFGPDALKHQPAGFQTKNWNVGLGGLFALPLWAAAIARGKCN